MQVLCDYLLYHDHNPRLALELCAKATLIADYQDWWWKARLGKCYYQLGLYRDAEKQYLDELPANAQTEPEAAAPTWKSPPLSLSQST